MEELQITTHERNEMIDITRDIQKIIDTTRFKEGILIAFVPHTTAGITLNEGADPDVQHDIRTALKKLIPNDQSYLHGEGNSDAHIKASLIGSSITVIVEQGKLLLGTWQHIFFYEGDGPRKRSVYITTLQKKDG